MAGTEMMRQRYRVAIVNRGRGIEAAVSLRSNDGAAVITIRSGFSILSEIGADDGAYAERLAAAINGAFAPPPETGPAQAGPAERFDDAEDPFHADAERHWRALREMVATAEEAGWDATAGNRIVLDDARTALAALALVLNIRDPAAASPPPPQPEAETVAP